MAHITEFEVQGLVGRSDGYSRRLNRDVNVFFGVNGSGKTSLLKILHGAMANEIRSLAAVPFASARVCIYSNDYQQEFEYTYDKRTDPLPSKADIPNVAAEWAVAVTRFQLPSPDPGWTISPPRPKDAAGRWAHRYLPTSRLFGRTDATWRARDAYDVTASEEALESVLAELLGHLWASYSAEVLGNAKRVQEDGLNRILRSVLSKRPERVARVIDADEAYRRATIFLGGTAVRLLGTQSDFRQRFTSDTHMQNVIAHISEIQERVEQMTIPRTRLQLLIREMFSGPKEVRFSDNGIEIRAPGEKSIPLASLSSGEKQLLRILLEALTAEKNSIIVDEPEISMHVEWQRRLLNAMQTLNSGCQIVVATHSPEIMADVDDDKIFRL